MFYKTMYGTVLEKDAFLCSNCSDTHTTTVVKVQFSKTVCKEATVWITLCCRVKQSRDKGYVALPSFSYKAICLYT